MNAIQEHARRSRKERTERIYAAVKNASPELYERAVCTASMTPGLELPARAELERQIMGLVLEALSACPHEGGV